MFSMLHYLVIDCRVNKMPRAQFKELEVKWYGIVWEDDIPFFSQENGEEIFLEEKSNWFSKAGKGHGSYPPPNPSINPAAPRRLS